MVSVFPFCLLFSRFLGVFRFPWCFPFPRRSPFCSMFSILLGVFSFGWGSQNYEQKFAFMTTLNISAWSNQNSKPKYTFTSFSHYRVSVAARKTKNPKNALMTKLQFCLAQSK
jgi:hypothetical protein